MLFLFLKSKSLELKTTYPFDPNLKHHIIIGLLLALWIFSFLYFTEPLDVSEFGNQEKLIYLPGYGLIGGLCYILFLPFQAYLYRIGNKRWTLLNELVFFIVFCVFAISISRLYYLFVVVPNEPNAYSLSYMLTDIYFPALITILPILIIGRYAFGKYSTKKLEAKKIEIQGEGNYEGLKLFIDDLICIQSSDNYIEVFYTSGKELKKTLIRNKLSKIDEEFEELFRTHRSHLINPIHFLSWNVENGKHFLMMNYDISVPVSKTYLIGLKSTLNFTTK